MSGRIYGRVYELLLRGQSPDTHVYVGKVKAPTSIKARVFGSSASAHTSPQSIARDPWKAGIVSYKQLEVVYATGDPTEDDKALRRAEAYWMDRLKTTKNIVRPIREAGRATPPRPTRAVPVREMARRRRRNGRTFAVLALAVMLTALTARVIVAMDLPWPAAPWVVSPAVGTLAAWHVFWRLHREFRRLTR